MSTLSEHTRKLVVIQNITLDGRVEMLGDWFDEQGVRSDLSDLMDANREHREASDALLVGRRTFTDFRGYWRDLPDDRTGVSDHLNAVAKYVVTTTLTDLDWAGSQAIGFDDVAALKQQPGRDIVCTGSISLCHDLLAAGLVDELRLFTYPVVQGRGRGLWPDGFEAAGLRRLDCRPFRSGVTLTTYALG